jgi:hypothetical protein
MDQIAEKYVHLTLAVGQHDANYVDAYYGPAEWKAEVERQQTSLPEIREKALEARSALDDSPPDGLDEMSSLRWNCLAKQLEGLIARVDMLSGANMSFDEESSRLYDVVDPGRPDSFYEAVLADLQPALPGTGSIGERFDRFRSLFNIPKDKLGEVFKASIEAARDRTKQHIDMPANENFSIEYVAGEVWGAYNWYKGNAHSLIQVNTDFPITIDRALHLACHEGYPGHHVYNALLEKHLAKDRKWVEFTVYALYSPQSLIAEGTAEYGVELSFPKEERQEFERAILYPLAGLDSAQAVEYARVRALMDRLGYASNDAAKRYLDGQTTRKETIDWLATFTLSTPERAEQRVRFIEAHRSYVVTYNLGLDLVRAYVDANAATQEDRWALFTKLLSTPQTPSNLRMASS